MHQRLLGGLLLLAALRGAFLPQHQAFPGWQQEHGGPSTLVPNLVSDDALRLSWLPGVGSFRAHQIVEQRPFLQFPLQPERLALLPGIGATTALEVTQWYALCVQGKRCAALE